jgi:hypothetical protein
MVASDHDFVATTYRESSEGVRKVATIGSTGYCLSLRRGSFERPAQQNELYLDKPYILETEAIRRSTNPGTGFHPRTPADSDLQSHTILRYAHNLYTIPATFRHEFHYADELDGVAAQASDFAHRFLSESRK